MPKKMHCDLCDCVIREGQQIFATGFYGISDDFLELCASCVGTRFGDVAAFAQSKRDTQKSPKNPLEALLGMRPQREDPEVAQ